MATRMFAELLTCLQLCLFVSAANAQFAPVQIKVKYICRSEGRSWRSYNGGEKHYCWEGKHYSKSTGGVPEFVLDYWAEKEQESAQRSQEIKRNSEETIARAAASRAAAEESRRAAGLPSFEEARRAAQERHRAAMERTGARPSAAGGSNWTAAGVRIVEQSQRPIHEPLPLDLFNGLDSGVERAAVIAKLGQPHGSITNLGSSGDEESMTYLVENGGNAAIRLKQGKLLTIRLPQRSGQQAGR